MTRTDRQWLGVVAGLAVTAVVLRATASWLRRVES